MATVKGWVIRSEEPHLYFWALDPAVEHCCTTDISKALQFARKEDAQHYLAHHFHPDTISVYRVDGIN